MTTQDRIIKRILLIAQIIFVVATAYFIFFHLTHYHPFEYPNSGEDDLFIERAYQYTQGNPVKDLYRPVLYPLMTAGVSSLFNLDVFSAGKLVSHLFGLLFVVTTILIGNKVFSQSVGLLSATLLILTYVVCFITMTAATDIAFSAMALLTLLIAIYYAEKKSWAWLVALAFVTAMSYFLRYTSLFLAAPIGILFLYAYWNDKVNFLKHAGAFVVLILVFLIPHMILTYQMFGEPFYNEAWKNLSLKLYGELNRFDSSSELLRSSYPLIIQTGAGGINRFFSTGLDGLPNCSHIH